MTQKSCSKIWILTKFRESFFFIKVKRIYFSGWQIEWKGQLVWHCAHRESIDEKTDADEMLVTSRRSVKRVACADSALRLTLEFHKRCEKPRETDGLSFSLQPPTVSPPTQRSPALPSAETEPHHAGPLYLFLRGVRNRWLFVLRRNPPRTPIWWFDRCKCIFILKKLKKKLLHIIDVLQYFETKKYIYIWTCARVELEIFKNHIF